MNYHTEKRTMLEQYRHREAPRWPPGSYCLTLLQKVVIILISYVILLVLIKKKKTLCKWILLYLASFAQFVSFLKSLLLMMDI